MAPESFQERPDDTPKDAEAEMLSKAGATLDTRSGVWTIRIDLGDDNGHTGWVMFRKNQKEGRWEWTNSSKEATASGHWSGKQPLKLDLGNITSEQRKNRVEMNRLADALHMKNVTAEQGKQGEKLRSIADDYLNKEKVAAGNAITPDVEQHVGSVDLSLGYLPFLEHLVEEMKDKDELLPDNANEDRSERNLLFDAAASIGVNLRTLSGELDRAPVKSGAAYEHLRQVYLDRSKRFTELMANVNERDENLQLRDGGLAAEHAKDTLSHMTAEEGIEWVAQMMSTIDGNDWQSGPLKKVYGELANACCYGLKKKLAEEGRVAEGNPELLEKYRQNCIDAAKLFTDRSSPIDSGLTNPDFAASATMDAIDFSELAMRYMERQLKRDNPIKQYIEMQKPLLLPLPDAMMQNPDIANAVRIIETQTPETIKDFSQHYTIIRQLQHLKSNQPMPFPDCNKEINDAMGVFISNSMGKFENFLDGGYIDVNGNRSLAHPGFTGLDHTDAATVEQIQEKTGVTFTEKQREAFALLGDIKGYGFDVSDHTWRMVGEGGKIAAAIAAGVALGAFTAGAGFGVMGTMLAGGAGGTVTTMATQQLTFETFGDLSKEFTLNATTAGAGRYFSAGRVMYNMQRGGKLSEAGIRNVLVAATKGGDKWKNFLTQSDEALSIGTRLSGMTMENAAGTMADASFNTMIMGGNFLDNLKRASFGFGFGMGTEMASSLRGLRNLPDDQLQGLSQLTKKAVAQQDRLGQLCFGTGLEPGKLLDVPDLATTLKSKNIDSKQATEIKEACDALRGMRGEMEAMQSIMKANADATPENKPERLDLSDRGQAMKQVIMSLPDTPEGLGMRLEAGAYVLGIEPRNMTGGQKEAIIKAHKIQMADGVKYSHGELGQKWKILEDVGGFQPEQIRQLMRMGVCGAPPPPPFLKNKNAAEAAPALAPQPKPLEKVSVTIPDALQATDIGTNLPITVKPGAYRAMVRADGKHVLLDDSGATLRIYEVKPGQVFEAALPSAPVTAQQAPRAVPPPPPPAPRHAPSGNAAPANTAALPSWMTNRNKPTSAPTAEPSLANSTPTSPSSSVQRVDASHARTPTAALETPVSPAVQATILKAAQLGKETNGSLSPLLAAELSAMDGNPVSVKNHFTYQSGIKKGGVMGYADVVDDKFADILQKSGIDTRMNPDLNVRTVRDGNDLRFSKELQKTIQRSETSKAIETVNIIPKSNGMSLLNYNYYSGGYKDSAGRPGALLEVSILLPAEKAKAIHAELKKNPDAIRTFFIASAQNTPYADYTWSKHVPNYADIADRRVFFNEKTDTALTAEVVRKNGTTWGPDTLTKDESRLLQEQQPSKTKEIPRVQPPKPEPKKGLLGRLFG